MDPFPFDEALAKEIEQKFSARLHDALDTAKHPKKESYHLVDEIKKEIMASLPEGDKEKPALAARAFERLREHYFREDILHRNRRPDARAFDEIRQITCEVGVLPRAHGSALFTRGETQALATTTLGTKEDKQRLDLLFEDEAFKRFMLHYNFPPFSVGREVKFLARAGTSRDRARRTRRARSSEFAPARDGFPIRDASGVGHHGIEWFLFHGHSLRRFSVADGCRCADSRGVRRDRDGPRCRGRKAAVLTDIAGAEDHYGDMDFKVAGTRNGNYRAFQMDIKVGGVSVALMRQALEQARRGRLHILDIMDQTISSARDKMSVFAPRLYLLQIPTDKIRDLIGPGGKKIRSIIEATGVKIDVMDDGKVHTCSPTTALLPTRRSR